MHHLLLYVSVLLLLVGFFIFLVPLSSLCWQLKMSILNSELKNIFKNIYIENYDLQAYRMTACGKSDG